MELLPVLMNQQTTYQDQGKPPGVLQETSSSHQVGMATPMARDVMLPNHPNI